MQKDSFGRAVRLFLNGIKSVREKNQIGLVFLKCYFSRSFCWRKEGWSRIYIFIILAIVSKALRPLQINGCVTIKGGSFMISDVGGEW